MTAKLQTILSTILLLLAFLHCQCEATVSGGIDAKIGTGDATIVTSPIDRSIIRGNGGTMDDIRHLNGEEVNVHKRKESPYFNVRVPYALIACIIIYFFTLVGLLLLIPFFVNERRNFCKSAFWVADNHLKNSAETTKQCMQFGSETIKIKADENTEEQTATLLADISVPSVACGAIMATTLFLVIPESILQIQRGTSSNEGGIEILSGTISRFGAALMMGFMLHLVLGAMFPRSSRKIISGENESSSDLQSTNTSVHLTKQLNNVTYDEEKNDEDGDTNISESERDFKESIFERTQLNNVTYDEEKNDEDGDTNISVSEREFKESIFEGTNNDKSIDEASKDTIHKFVNIFYIARLSISIIYDDAAHDMFDGVFIGCAFMTCSTATAVCITMITIYIEMSRKVASYFLLTECAQVSPIRAILSIFASGFAVIVGVSLILASTVYIGELTIGVFLAIASGVYLHISATECLTRIYSVVKVSRDRLFTVLFFVIGTLPIGFTFFNHGHCDV